MSLSKGYLKSSIGKKQIMAVTGAGLIGFALTHLLGNLLIFLGPDKFNLYAYTLTSNPLIYLAEAILLSLFLGHIVIALVVNIQNRSARSQSYYKKTRTGRGETIASKTMPLTGIILLVFLVLHLINFKYGTDYLTTVDGVEMRDLYRLVVEYFANPLYVAWYVFAMISFGLHTSHGFWSMTQTWGFDHPKYNSIVKCLSNAYGVLVAAGFSSLAIYCYFQN